MKEQEETEGMFEREWREAFENVTQEPPKIVWSEIDRALAHDQANGYRKKAVYYRWAAAAVFLLATTIGLLQILADEFNLRSVSEVQQIEASIPVTESPKDNRSLELDSSKEKEEEAESEPNHSAQTESSGSYNAYLRAASSMSEDGGAGNNNNGDSFQTSGSSFNRFISFFTGDDQQNDNMDAENSMAKTEDGSVYDVNSKSPDIAMQEPKLVEHIYMVPNPSNAKRKRANNSSNDVDDRYWAGVDMNSGTFDPNYQSTGGSLNSSLVLNPAAQFSQLDSDILNTADPAVSESMSGGQMLAFGIDMGMRLSDKWSIHGGLQYVKANATNNTNMVVATTQIVENIAVTKQVRGVNQVQDVVEQEEVVKYNYEDVELDNEFQFASIPVSVGYRILDKKLSVELNGGVAANIHLGNKLSDSDNQVANVNVSPGSESPYKPLSFMGLAGVQLSYELIKHFDVLLQPNYRHSLSDLTKSNSDFTSAPSGFGLQTGIRYRFD